MMQSEKNGFHEREMKCYRSSEDGEREIPACPIQGSFSGGNSIWICIRDGQGGLACCDSGGHKDLDTTE